LSLSRGSLDVLPVSCADAGKHVREHANSSRIGALRRNSTPPHATLLGCYPADRAGVARDLDALDFFGGPWDGAGNRGLGLVTRDVTNRPGTAMDPICRVTCQPFGRWSTTARRPANGG